MGKEMNHQNPKERTCADDVCRGNPCGCPRTCTGDRGRRGNTEKTIISGIRDDVSRHKLSFQASVSGNQSTSCRRQNVILRDIRQNSLISLEPTYRHQPSSGMPSGSVTSIFNYTGWDTHVKDISQRNTI